MSGPPLRVMPLGDSVTAGSGSGAYRRRLFGLLAAAYPGRAIDFVGTASDRASAPLPDRNHEGHGGYAIGDLLANLDGDDGRWNNGGGHWLTGTATRPAIVPSVVLLHAGTNDVPDPVTPAGLRDRLDDLIEKITSRRPDARLLVADPIVRADAAEPKSAAYGALIPALVAKHAALGRRVTFVDMHSRLTTADLSDGLHPNATGEDKMADAWAAAIRAAVPPGAGG